MQKEFKYNNTDHHSKIKLDNNHLISNQSLNPNLQRIVENK
jgi:hypothetical protein